MKEIIFKKLYGRFDYDIVLKDDGLTILTGPNGYGKTSILNSIWSLKNSISGLIFFDNLEFEEIIFIFSDNTRTILEKKDNDVLYLDGEKIDSKELKKKITVDICKKNYIIRVGENRFLSRHTGHEFSLDENGEIINTLVKKMNLSFDKKTQNYINNLGKNIAEISFIKDQRLVAENILVFEEKKLVNVIELLPKEIINMMTKIQQEYSVVSNELDSTYPIRLFENDIAITEFQYDEKMSEISKEFIKLKKYNLFEGNISDNIIFKEEYAKALKVFFDDLDKKFSIYSKFVDKLELYTEIINSRLLFKHIEISNEFGMNVLDDFGRNIPLSKLSSGEKQEIVMFYRLIFSTREGMILLLDEPEISLHVLWQKGFMDDLLKIIKHNKIKVIVATHSPQIINNHWDLQVDLGGLCCV